MNKPGPKQGTTWKWKACPHWNGHTRRIVCDECKKARCKVLSRQNWKRKYVPKVRAPKTCAICGVMAAPKKRLCPTCKEKNAENSRLRAIAKRHQQRRLQRELHPKTCVDCGVVLPIRDKSNLIDNRERCDACRRVQRKLMGSSDRHRRRIAIYNSRPEPSEQPWLATFKAIGGRLTGKAKEKHLAEYENATLAYAIERDGWKCGICNRKINRDLPSHHPLSATLDHIMPLAKGGSHTKSNIQPAHLRCNVLKKDRFGGQFALSL